MKTKFSLIVAFVIFALLLTACSISITTKVNADGSGELGFAYKFTKDDLSQLSGMGLSGDTICTDLQSQGGTDMPADFNFKQEKHGDETWCVGAKTFTDLESLKSEISGEGFTINTMEITDGKFVFDAVADMSSADTGGMPISITINYDLTAPGKIDQKASNAKSYDGNTATWALSLGGSTPMHLESSTKGGGGGGDNVFNKKVANVPVWGIVVAVCCCLLLVVIIVVVIFFVMKRKPKQPAM